MIYEGCIQLTEYRFPAAGQHACWELLFYHETSQFPFKTRRLCTQVPTATLIRKHRHECRGQGDMFSVTVCLSPLTHTIRDIRSSSPSVQPSPQFLGAPPQLLRLPLPPSGLPDAVGGSERPRGSASPSPSKNREHFSLLHREMHTHIPTSTFILDK